VKFLYQPKFDIEKNTVVGAEVAVQRAVGISTEAELRMLAELVRRRSRLFARQAYALRRIKYDHQQFARWLIFYT
jgi:hypothetical protein